MNAVNLNRTKNHPMKKIILVCLLLTGFAEAQLLNGGMENYTFTSTDTVPQDWSVNINFSTQVGKTTDANSGNFSFVINTWYNYSPGIMVNGYLPSSWNWFDEWVRAGTPVSGKPSRLSGFYKYVDTVANDSAIVKVLLKKWNSGQNKIDSVALGEKKLPFAQGWTAFDVDLADLAPGVSPDSLVVFFMSYDYLAGTQPICMNSFCRFLYIDDLSLSGLLGVNEAVPAGTISFLQSENEIVLTKSDQQKAVAEIFSCDGKLVGKKEIYPGTNRIDLSLLQRGIYLVRCAGALTQVFRFAKP